MAAIPYSDRALERIGQTVARHVEDGDAPGAVWAVARGEQVHLEAVGHTAVDGTEAMATDALFRISSMTKPVTAVAALSCVEDGLFRLEEPVDRLLPELAGRKVLEHEDAPLGWVVPARRPILVRDLLTFTMGMGIVMAAPGEIPLADALVELELGQGPPMPHVPPPPDEWMRRLGTLPLLHHPGERWSYGTGSDLLGVLVARATGLPFDEALEQRVLEPLGMVDTSFSVGSDDLPRLVPGYATDPATGALDEYDPPDGAWSRPPAFPSGAAGLVSTTSDMLAFARMLLAGGVGPDGRRIVSRAAIAAMTTDQLTPAQKGSGLVDSTFRGRGWGFGVSVVTRRTDIAGSVGAYGWDGGLGTCWMNDPTEELVTLLFTQAAWASPELPAIASDFRTTAWAALDG